MERIYAAFMAYMEQSTKYADVPAQLSEKYKNVFLGPKDRKDLLPRIWEKYGLNAYGNGVFWLVNPDEYNEPARAFPGVSGAAIVFARSASGCLFLWEEFSFGKAITHLNIHKGTNEVIGANFHTLLEWDLSGPDFWKEECYGSMEFQMVKKFQQLNADECVGFTVALALSGNESVANTKVFKIKEQLQFLAALHSGEERSNLYLPSETSASLFSEF